MCLNTITKRVEKPSKKVTKAWKVFYKDSSNQVKFYYYRWIHKQPQQGRWIVADEQPIKTNDYINEYMSGFHCYTNKEQAEKFHGSDLKRTDIVLLEVKVKEITTYGSQWNSVPCDVIVARQMLIPRLKQNKVK